jgi:ABC-2 type transport system permease protein
VLLFGFAIKNEIVGAKIAILDKSKDAVTRNIINKINSGAYYSIEYYLHSDKEIEDAFKTGKLKQVIIFGDK